MRRCVALLALVAGLLVGCGDSAPASPRGAKVLRMTIDSDAVGRKLPLRIVIPSGGGERPLLVFLHGKGMSATSFLVDPFYKALAELGARAPIVAFPSGGDHSYWHDRADGDWGRYVIKEVIPQVTERSGADGDRVAIGGISMGGFGAYDLARLNPGRFCGVGGHSPALWRTAGETAPGAFDDAADFERHDVVGDGRRLRDERLWLDAGDGDPFIPGARAFSATADVKLRLMAGGHNSDYWNRNWARYLRFYARSLKDCD